MTNNKITYNKGNNISSVAFIFACPGQKEEAAGKVVAGATGKNLDRLLSILSSSQISEVRRLFPSSNRYDYLITNSSDIIHYPALDGISLPSKKEYREEKNVERLFSELSDSRYIISFGQQAKDVLFNVSHLFHKRGISPSPNLICNIPHLSFLSLNQIKEDKEGKKIEKGDPEATEKRLKVVAGMVENALMICFKYNDFVF